MRSRSNAFSLIGILFCLAAPTAAGRDIGPDAAFGLKEALVALRASDAVWRRNDAEFRAMRKTDQASETESRQFAEFVAEQRRFMLEDCQQVRQLGGDPERLGFDCALPRQGDVASTGPPTDPASIPTEEEKDAALERRLTELEGDLDDLFKAKQDQLRRDPVHQSQSASAPDAAGGASGGDRAASGSGKDKPERGGRAKVGQEQGAGPGVDKSGRSPGSEASVTDEAPTGDGDDVVARQLREAAEKETDPVMKEKLWEEYKKYKEATS
ncbi:MAG: hypothetical protein O7D94_12365 [Planctomycetota bacterium]|nr:hypothetical protein [Planctomycetota bacterium]